MSRTSAIGRTRRRGLLWQRVCSPSVDGLRHRISCLDCLSGVAVCAYHIVPRPYQSITERRLEGRTKPFVVNVVPGETKELRRRPQGIPIDDLHGG